MRNIVRMVHRVTLDNHPHFRDTKVEENRNFLSDMRNPTWILRSENPFSHQTTGWHKSHFVIFNPPKFGCHSKWITPNSEKSWMLRPRMDQYMVVWRGTKHKKGETFSFLNWVSLFSLLASWRITFAWWPLMATLTGLFCNKSRAWASLR